MATNIPQLIGRDVSIGYNGIELYGAEEIGQNQIGYSISTDGVSLVGTREGDWKNEWLVIGRETCCGDPIFIDTSGPEFPVYTAADGEGSWNPYLISGSYIGLLRIIEQLVIVATGREYPTRMKDNPMTQKEYDKFLDQVGKLSGLQDIFFWALMISDEEAGIGPET
jgi:hypothetical protein